MEYRGYDIIQNESNHIIIVKDKMVVSHINYTRKATEEEELKEIVDFVLNKAEKRMV